MTIVEFVKVMDNLVAGVPVNFAIIVHAMLLLELVSINPTYALLLLIIATK
jgi:hypothetical protein